MLGYDPGIVHPRYGAHFYVRIAVHEVIYLLGSTLTAGKGEYGLSGKKRLFGIVYDACFHEFHQRLGKELSMYAKVAVIAEQRADSIRYTAYAYLQCCSIANSPCNKSSSLCIQLGVRLRY